MDDFLSTQSTAFEGDRLLANGTLADVALAVKAARETRPDAAFLVFDDATGKVIDLDLRGSDIDVIRRLTQQSEPGGRGANELTAEKAATRGRPKLGVVAREVTLLPRHWQWLNAQPGGASQSLRRLVDQARSAGDDKTRSRTAQEACYRFMSAMAGDFPGFEEASRTLFANDQERFAKLVEEWPRDVRDHVLRLAAPSWRSRPAPRQ